MTPTAQTCAVESLRRPEFNIHADSDDVIVLLCGLSQTHFGALMPPGGQRRVRAHIEDLNPGHACLVRDGKSKVLR
jgi:hypothetical protein